MSYGTWNGQNHYEMSSAQQESHRLAVMNASNPSWQQNIYGSGAPSSCATDGAYYSSGSGYSGDTYDAGSHRSISDQPYISSYTQCTYEDYGYCKCGSCIFKRWMDVKCSGDKFFCKCFSCHSDRILEKSKQERAMSEAIRSGRIFKEIFAALIVDPIKRRIESIKDFFTCKKKTSINFNCT